MSIGAALRGQRRTVGLVVLLTFVASGMAWPELSETPGDPAPARQLLLNASTDWLAQRTGIRSGFTVRMVRAIGKADRWLQADFESFGSHRGGGERKVWIGGGGSVVRGPRARLELRCGFSEAETSPAANERYLETNAFLRRKLSSVWTLELSHTEAVALNEAAVSQRRLDRARLEYRLARYRIGAGYAGQQGARRSWEHRPFVSVSRTLKGNGELEIWLQRIEADQGPAARLHVRLSKRLLR